MNNSLYDLFSFVGQVPEIVLQGITRSILAALIYLHGLGECHKGITPSQILFDGKAGVKLAPGF